MADLIHVEKRYETAIETALGGAIQNIVTDTEQTAKHMIEYLKQGRLDELRFCRLMQSRCEMSFRKRMH